jgi:hypothetical protein
MIDEADEVSFIQSLAYANGHQKGLNCPEGW